MQTHRFAAAQGRDPEGRSWYRMVNKIDGPIEVFLYSEIGMWGVTADMFLDELTPLAGRDITLRINSEGGEVFDGVAIYNALQRHGGRINAHVDGLAASAASFIAMAADEIVMEPGSQMMIHDAIGFCYGNEAEMEKMRGMLARTSDTIAMIYAERAGGVADDWREIMRGERWYDGAAAVAAGLADRVGEGRERGQKTADNRIGAGQSKPANAPANYYGEGPGERDGDGRFADGMPDAIASYAFATAAGALTATRTREGVELSDGANAVTLRPAETRRIEAAMRNGYAENETLINRHVEIDGKLHSVTVARVRPQGSGQNEDGETTATHMRLDLGQVEDSDEYDSRTGVLFTAAQADRFEQTIGLADVAERVQTGYGPLDLLPNAAGDGMVLRMRAESGYPTEVEFSRPEWKRINTAIDTLVDGFDESTPEGTDVNAITVRTKAGKVELEWKGPREEGGGYSPEARMLITPQYDAPWSVVIDGAHMAEAFDPIGQINTAIGVTDRTSGARVLASGRPAAPRPKRRPRSIRTRPGTLAPRNALPITWDRDTDGSQLRGDDGKWVDTPGTGIAWDKYTSLYDVYDESSTRSGLAVVTMSTGEMQLAWDDAGDDSVRHVFNDFGGPDDGPRELRDALREAVDSEVQDDFELFDEDDPSQIWASVTRNEQSITLFVPGTVEANDFEIEIDLDEAEELIDAFDEQFERHGELIADTADSPADTWDRALIALTTRQPVSSSADDHPVSPDHALPFWETT